MGITRILNAIFEPNFLDCSYGFRTGRSCHQALKQLDNTIMTKPVNHLIDADIRSFFDNVDVCVNLLGVVFFGEKKSSGFG